MPLSGHNSPAPEAFRGFLEGVQSLQDYLRTNAIERLVEAGKQLDESLAADPEFAPARYYKAVVLTHAREADGAINLLESLNQGNPPFKAEILYNLAFAYARKYKYDSFIKSLKSLDEAKKSVPRYAFLGLPLNTKRPDLVLLIQAMQAWVMAAFSGRAYGQGPKDFELRRKEYLPRAERLAKSVLADRRLKKLPPDARAAAKVEAHNAAGITYMRMGQYSKQFEQDANQYWQLSEDHYQAALALHMHDVRVLDNLSTLNLIRACYAQRHKKLDDVKDIHRAGQNQILPDAQRHEKLGDVEVYASKARDTETKAINLNPDDRFRWLNRGRAYVLLGAWENAKTDAKKIRSKKGEVTEDTIKSLEDAISHHDVAPILDAYPIEEKSSS